MIAFRVKLNGKPVCIAGDEDLSVLSAIVTAVGKLGRKTASGRPNEAVADIHYSVGGLTARPDPDKDVHVRWQSIAPLKVGDVVEVAVVEAEKADRAKSRKRAKKTRS